MQFIVVEKVSENMADAAVGAWFVEEGDPVHRGQAVVELVTEKATFEIEAEEDGILLRRLAPSKSILPVGYTVAVIGRKGEEVPADVTRKNRELLSASAPPLPASPSTPGPSPRRRGARVKATPAARRRAKTHGIDLEEVKRTLGVTGVISEKDVLRYLEEGRGDAS